MILADTNILLRSLHSADPHYDVVKNAVKLLRLQNETFCVAPQNLVEFWAVATRPLNENGLGMPVTSAAQEIAALREFFRLLPYTADVLERWQRLVLDQGVVGKQTHDAHIVAVMQVYSVASILTFNGAHFKRFPGIGVLDPAQVSASYD